MVIYRMYGGSLPAKVKTIVYILYSLQCTLPLFLLMRHDIACSLGF
jgi:hypothetical protein